jgi:hypothetical protein
MARTSTTSNGKSNDKYRGHQKHENRLNPEKDHVPGHLGYTRANLEGVVSEKPRKETRRVGTRKNTAMESSKPRRTASRSKQTEETSMEGRPNKGGRGTNRRGAAASKSARAGSRTRH